MPHYFSTLFYIGFPFIVFCGLYLYKVNFNKQSAAINESFLAQTKALQPIIFENIKLSYFETRGFKIRYYPKNVADLYLFDNALVIMRRQNFIFKVTYPPLILTADVKSKKNALNNHAYKPYSIIFKQVLKGEVEIKIRKSEYKRCTIDITFKGLNNDQLIKLEKIKEWC